MLKLTYTDNSFRLEHLTPSLEDWVTNRVILALRSATSLCLEPSTASFLLPADLPHLADLAKVVEQDNGDIIELSPCDPEYIEVILQGTWLVSAPGSEEGIFVCTMVEKAEFFLYKLWQESQTIASVVND